MENIGQYAVVFVIGVLAGFAIGRWSAPGTWEEGPGELEAATPIAGSATPPPEPPSAPAPSTAGTHSATPEAPEAEPAPADQPSREALEAEVAMLQGLLAGYEEQVNGLPIPWPDDAPDKFREAGFGSSLRQAIADCAPPVDLVGLECDETPCIAMLRTSQGWHDALVNRCDGWKDEYGTTVSQYTGEVDCGDGVTERVALLSPFDHEWHEGLGKEDKANMGRRLRFRWEQITTDWECAN